MAKHQPTRSGTGLFDIVLPVKDQSVPLNAGCTVTVEVDDRGGHDAFGAAIICLCDPVPSFGSCTPLTRVGASNTWRGNVPVGYLDPFDILEDHKIVVVWGRKTPDVAKKTNAFRITRGGSGSTCAGSGSQSRCGSCSAVQPVPVCLQLTSAGGIANAACAHCTLLNQPALLIHSGDACLSCIWFSGPLAFCGANPAYWKLEKTSARAWDLRCARLSPMPLRSIWSSTRSLPPWTTTVRSRSRSRFRPPPQPEPRTVPPGPPRSGSLQPREVSCFLYPCVVGATSRAPESMSAAPRGSSSRRTLSGKTSAGSATTSITNRPRPAAQPPVSPPRRGDGSDDRMPLVRGEGPAQALRLRPARAVLPHSGRRGVAGGALLRPLCGLPGTRPVRCRLGDDAGPG